MDLDDPNLDVAVDTTGDETNVRGRVHRTKLRPPHQAEHIQGLAQEALWTPAAAPQAQGSLSRWTSPRHGRMR
jgi:hypothetical protein